MPPSTPANPRTNQRWRTANISSVGRTQRALSCAWSYGPPKRNETGCPTSGRGCQKWEFRQSKDERVRPAREASVQVASLSQKISVQVKGPCQAQGPFARSSFNCPKPPTSRTLPDSARTHSCTAPSRKNMSGCHTASDAGSSRRLSFHKPDLWSWHSLLRSLTFTADCRRNATHFRSGNSCN